MESVVDPFVPMFSALVEVVGNAPNGDRTFVGMEGVRLTGLLINLFISNEVLELEGLPVK